MECPGFYCGRTVLEDGAFSECGACPSGTHVNATWKCEECHHSPTLYDWMYLVCMSFVPLLFNTIFIDISINKKNYHNLAFHFSALLETSIAFLLALLIFQPAGSFELISCDSESLSDWYTLFFNPIPDFVTTLHCTYEAVYPLYSIVFLMHFFNLLSTLAFRCLLSKFLSHPCPCSLYASLFLHPPLAAIHGIFAGLIYYCYPYTIIVITMVTNAMHFASFKEESPRGLLKELFSNLRNILLLLLHSSCLVFAVFSLLQCSSFQNEMILYSAVAFPPVVYILTAPFTAPQLIFPETSC